MFLCLRSYFCVWCVLGLFFEASFEAPLHFCRTLSQGVDAGHTLQPPAPPSSHETTFLLIRVRFRVCGGKGGHFVVCKIFTNLRVLRGYGFVRTDPHYA